MNHQQEIHKHTISIGILNRIIGNIGLIDYYKELIESKKEGEQIAPHWSISDLEHKINQLRDSVYVSELEYKKLNG